MSSSKQLTCKGTLRQMLIRVYRLEIQPVMFVFSTQLSELLPLTFSLVQLSPSPPLPCVNKYTVYTYTVSKGGGRFWASDRLKPAAKSFLQVNFFR